MFNQSQLQGGSIAKKTDFQTFRPQFYGVGIAVAHCHPLLKTPDDVNHTLQNLTHVTTGTDVIAEMFKQKNV